MKPVSGVDQAVAEWGATSGPVALAGVLEVESVTGVRQAVARSRFVPPMGINDMRSAVDKAGGTIVWQESRPDKRVLANSHEFPMLVLIQWGGPWIDTPRQAAARRHWIAYRHAPVELASVRTGEPMPTRPAIGWVLDLVNPGVDGGAIWIPLAWWRDHVLPRLLPEDGDGESTFAWAGLVARAGNEPGHDRS